MRIREDGKHAHRTATIEAAAKFWDCNKTTALMQSVEFATRMDERIRDVLERDDLTPRQKREIAETLSIPNTYEVKVIEELDVERVA